MIKKSILFAFFAILTLGSFSQRPTMELTYTAVNNTDWVQLDSIKIMNRTQGGDTLLYWPDTVLVLDFTTQVPEIKTEDQGFRVFQNYPNPVSEHTTVSLYIPEKDKVSIIVTDILGRVIIQFDRTLDMGSHSFRFIPGAGNIYFFTAMWQAHSNSIKMLNLSSGKNTASLEYIGGEAVIRNVKAMEDIQEFAFNPGDVLLSVGYANGLESGMFDSPEENTNYTFQFGTNIPCPGTPTVEYEGQVYNTIQIFSQCWLKENLNVGTMISGNQSNNRIIEKYCYNNVPDSCTKYGGLYEWEEMMQYNWSGTRGICPPGWHLPRDEEWGVLEGAVDSQYGIGDPEWDHWGSRGYDVGTNLKTTSGWYENGNGTDLFGFSGLPGGFGGGGFDDVSRGGHWWSTTPISGFETGYSHLLYFNGPDVVYWSVFPPVAGLSVRCLRDEIIIPTIELTFTAVNIASYVQLDSIKVMNRTQSGETMIYWPDTTLVVPGYLTFTPGDELLFIGYANGLESGMLDSPDESTPYTFQFATNIPCLGTPTVDYEGQVYNTIQIFSQCWLKENLNVGTMITGNQSQNGIIEKFCYNNEPDSCTKYGGLYQWDEMMQYNWSGTRGICPPGWHLPRVDEWNVLEGAVDSQYGIGDPEWGQGGSRGYDAGTNLKTTSGWYGNGNGTDLFGFSGLPGGFGGGGFDDVSHFGHWWTTLPDGTGNVHSHLLYFNSPEVGSWTMFVPSAGLSVRCLRDEIIIPTIELTFSAVNNASYVQLDSIKIMNRTQDEETTIYWPDTTLVVPGYLAFTPGDKLLYIGYVNGLESGILDAPEENTTYTFQFATNIPCPGTPTVEYEGQVYNTIQIFSQCWLKENLNVGEMISGGYHQSDNGTIEKYCYDNSPDKCNKYGGLYQFDEMMQYSLQPGARGICPPGWHLPTDEEWKVLEGAVDSLYGISDDTWDDQGWRGYDSGTNLKTTSGWIQDGNGTDLFGFSGLPGGYRGDMGGYSGTGYLGHFWSSTESDFSYAWGHYLYYFRHGVFRYDGYSKGHGFSVRCLRDEIIIPTIELTFSAVSIVSYIQLDSIKIMNRTQNEETMIYWPDTTLVVPGELVFNPGDELLYVGYTNGLESGIPDSPEESTPYTFQFATNIPCPGTPTVEYAGQVYNTIQVFSQCWLKENLNVGEMIYGGSEQSDNGTIEKYCYNDKPDSCTKYGGLYQWNEMMQYTTQQGARGICPPGWHLPTDEDWKVLEGAVDSQYGIGDQEWDYRYNRGYNAGMNLKSTSGWNQDGNGTDLFGFSGLPGGYLSFSGEGFYDVGDSGFWRTSTEYDYWEWGAWYRGLDDLNPESYRWFGGYDWGKECGFSVRCLRDY